MSNLWYILNKSEHHQRLQQQLQLQLRQQLELPPGMSSERFQLPPTPTAQPSPGSVVPSRDPIPFGQVPPYPPHPEIPFDPANAPPPTAPGGVTPSEQHNNIEWKYHTHRPEADGDALGRKAGKRKLVIPRDLLKMKQMNAALKIGIPPSTFSKRWRESLPDRTWPYRNHRRIEKNIKMLKAMQQKGHDVTEELGKMTQQQEENLSPAVIDVYEDVNEEYLLKVDDKKWPATTPTAGGNPAGAPPAAPSPHHHPYARPPQHTSPTQQQQQPQAPMLQITQIPHTQALPLVPPPKQHPTPPQQAQVSPNTTHQSPSQSPPVPHPMENNHNHTHNNHNHTNHINNNNNNHHNHTTAREPEPSHQQQQQQQQPPQQQQDSALKVEVSPPVNPPLNLPPSQPTQPLPSQEQTTAFPHAQPT